MCGAFAILETGPDGRGVVRIVEERNGRTFTEARHSRSAGSHWLDRWEDHGDPIRLKRRSGHMCPGGLFSFPGAACGGASDGHGLCVGSYVYIMHGRKGGLWRRRYPSAFHHGLLSGLEALLPGVFLGFLLGGLEAVWLLASGRQSLGRGPIWPLARPCAWDLGSACFMERGSFSGMRGFLAEYAQGDVYYGRY